MNYTKIGNMHDYIKNEIKKKKMITQSMYDHHQNLEKIFFSFFEVTFHKLLWHELFRLASFQILCRRSKLEIVLKNCRKLNK